jgi:ribose 5-phosphate isomerase B
MTANKIPGIRAVIAHDEWIVRRARAHHDCNVLCIPADLIGLPLIRSILETWVSTSFEGGRHERRVRKIAMVERGENPADYYEDDE